MNVPVFSLVKQHYAYEKYGSCALLAAIEPITGKRMAQVFQQLAASYPEAEKIRLVQDNRATTVSIPIPSLHYHLPADEAFALAQRFKFYYTPKSASWLNRIETVAAP